MAIDRLVINPIRITWRLSIVAGLLVAASLSLQGVKYLAGHPWVYGLVDLMNVDGEQNIPALYSVFLLLATSGLLGFVTFLARKAHSGDASKWALLGAGFAFMAIDEAWLLHERLINPVRRLLGGSPEHLGVFHFAWVVPAFGIIAVLGIYFIGFLWRLPATFRIRFLVAGAIYVGGAVGMELLGGAYSEGHGEDNLIYKIFTTVEESMEMAGVIAFIDALLRYLCANHQQVTTRFRENAADNTVLDLTHAVPAQLAPATTQFRAPRTASASPLPADPSHTVIRPPKDSGRAPAGDQTIMRPPKQSPHQSARSSNPGPGQRRT